ncbi:MAG TPA: peptidoglycan-binding domain-containing protein [Acidimicrobiia bacterium]|nr:peptidoglycan-binding domain-containing protein [Acidimicrobiia bacterium]
MPLRILSGRPRQLQLLVLSLIVLTVGVAAGFARLSGPSVQAAASISSASEFFDVPPATTGALDPPGVVATALPTDPAAATVERAAAAVIDAPITALVAPPDTTTTTAAPAPPPPPAAKPVIPLGKGMWLYQLSMAEGGDANKVVRKATAAGLTHLYLRLGSSKGGFYAQGELDKLLPAAHAAGLKVIGWDFVYLNDPAADAARAKAEIDYLTPTGHRIDGFSADIETGSEGVNLTAEGAAAYGAALRGLVGPSYPLIATVPRPSPKRAFPFAEATASFDAIAPMVYWQNRDPATDVAGAIAALAPLGKPILPVGQAYNGGPEGGPDRDPPKEQLVAFLNTAHAKGAVAVSFWVWNHATSEQWSAIDEAATWELPIGRTANGGAAVFLQRVLGVLGQPVAQDGQFGPATKAAIAAVQRNLGLPASGKLDAATARSITGPKLS